MLTKIDLCSMALLKIGEAPLQSLIDDTASAKLSRTLFDIVTDALLSSHPWRFACQTYNLVRNSEGNFLIPAEVLRILKSSDGNVTGNRILAKTDSVEILAITRVASEQYPSYFASLVATRLAMEFCIPLTGDQTMFRMLTALYETELQNAKFIDSTTSINSNIEQFSLINVRF